MLFWFSSWLTGDCVVRIVHVIALKRPSSALFNYHRVLFHSKCGFWRCVEFSICRERTVSIIMMTGNESPAVALPWTNWSGTLPERKKRKTRNVDSLGTDMKERLGIENLFLSYFIANSFVNSVIAQHDDRGCLPFRLRNWDSRGCCCGLIWSGRNCK